MPSKRNWVWKRKPMLISKETYNPYAPTFIHNALESRKLWLSKERGQNYLVDRNITERIIGSVPEGSVVFEVGSGLGALTGPLADRFKTYSLEIDRGIYSLLASLLDKPNLKLILDDFLEFDLESLPEKSLYFVSNLPYSISGEAIRRFIDCQAFHEGIVMLQSEFVDRMTAAPRDEAYGVFSILCGHYLEVERLFEAGRKCFFPAPKVDSAVVRIRKKASDIPQEAFNSFLRSSFQSRRKTVWNNLKSAGYPKDLLEKAGVDPAKRPEEISIPQWEKLFQLAKG